MSPFIVRKPRPRGTGTTGRGASVPRSRPGDPALRAKDYMERSSTRPSTSRSRSGRWSASATPEEEPGRARARRAAVPAAERAARRLGARHPRDRPRRGLLLRPPAPDQDPERGVGLLLAQQDDDREGPEGLGDHRLRRPQRRRAGHRAGAVQPVQDRRSSCSATSRSAGTRGASAASGTSARTSTSGGPGTSGSVLGARRSSRSGSSTTTSPSSTSSSPRTSAARTSSSPSR